MQKNDGAHAYMLYYDEVEVAAGNVSSVTMKDNPSYSVPAV